MILVIIVAITALTALEFVYGSIGEKSYVFQNCFESCTAENCSVRAPPFIIPFHLKVLQWSCVDECRYFCLWPAVEWFQNVGYGVPQFFGKWPQARLGGIEQPASALFSLINFSIHIIMLVIFRRHVSHRAPFYQITHIYCLIHSHAWIWSTVFHIRNVWVTEFLDYSSALVTILFSVFHFMSRLLATSRRRNLILIILTLMLVAYFGYHCFVRFYIIMDYKYNMVFNVGVCALNFVGWIIWCLANYKQRPYVKKCAVYIVLMGATTIFEIVDFPALFWAFDAHSFWHLSTPWLTILWYKFLIDDCHYLQKRVIISQVHQEDSLRRIETKESLS